MKKLIQLLSIFIFVSSVLFAQNPIGIHSCDTPREFQEAGGELYFTAETGLHHVSSAGVVSGNLFPGGVATYLTEFLGELYFVGTDSTDFSVAGVLYSYSTGTGLTAISYETIPGSARARVIGVGGSELYFTAGPIGAGLFNDTLYSLSISGLTNLGPAPPSFNNTIDPSKLLNYAGSLYFNGGGLYRLNSTLIPAFSIVTLDYMTDMVVHDSKLFLSNGTDLLSWDDGSLSTEYTGLSTGDNNYQSNMLSFGDDLYLLGDTGASLFLDLLKFDGSSMTVIDGAVVQYVGGGADFDPNGYLTEVGGEIYYGTSAALGGEIWKLIADVPRKVLGDQSPEFLNGHAGSLYFEADFVPSFPELNPQAPSIIGIQKLDVGPVAETFSLDSIGDCDSDTDSFKVYFEVRTHTSSMDGSYNLKIWEDTPGGNLPGGVVDTLEFIFAETASPQILEIDIPSSVFYFAAEDLNAQLTYSNADPATIDIAGLFPLTFDGEAACYGCDIVLDFGSQTCTGSGKYDQEITLIWAGDYPEGSFFDILINGEVYSSGSDTTVTVIVTDLDATGEFVSFDIDLADAGSTTPCMITDSILAPTCECSMSYERVGVASCIPGSGVYDYEILLSFENPPTTGLIDFGEFAGPIGTSPMTVLFFSLPSDGEIQGAAISFTDDPGCGVLAEWQAPLPDCTLPELPLCHPVSDEVLSAPVDLTKSFNPVPFPDGVQDRVQVKWYKESPSIRYAADEDVACDIEAWPVRDLITDLPITGDTIQIENVAKPGKELFKWPIKFRADGANNTKRVEPSTRYKWRVRCACEMEPEVESPWSAIKIFNTPAFDPSTGIYTPPPGIMMDENGELKRIGGTESLDFLVYPNPTVDIIYIDLMNENEELAFIQIMNVTGQVVKDVPISYANRDEEIITIQVAELNSGTYLIQLFTDTGSEVRRFTKE